MKFGPTAKKLVQTIIIAGGTISEIQSTADANGIASGKEYLNYNQIQKSLKRLYENGVIRCYYSHGKPVYYMMPKDKRRHG
jgi:hypothetical protein